MGCLRARSHRLGRGLQGQRGGPRKSPAQRAWGQQGRDRKGCGAMATKLEMPSGRGEMAGDARKFYRIGAGCGIVLIWSPSSGLPRPQCHHLSSVALRLDQGFLKWDSGTTCARICRICVKSSQILGCDQTPWVEPRQLSVSLRPQLVPPIVDV